jgi:hypothetical protein
VFDWRSSTLFNVPLLDRWIYGAKRIGEYAEIRNEDGTVNVQKVLYGLSHGLIDGEKYGRIWRSTPRRILSPKATVNKGTQQETAQSPSG